MAQQRKYTLRQLAMSILFVCGSTTAWADAKSDCLQRNDPDRKIRGCAEFIRDNPRNSRAYYFRGVGYHDKNELDHAIADYSMAIQIDPTYADAYSMRGAAFRAKGDLDRAVADSSTAIGLN